MPDRATVLPCRRLELVVHPLGKGSALPVSGERRMKNARYLRRCLLRPEAFLEPARFRRAERRPQGW